MSRTSPLAAAAVPTLDEVFADPERAAGLSPPALQRLLHRSAAVQTILLGALAANEQGATNAETDRLLKVTAAAERLGVSRDWLYHHARELPFTVRQRRLLRFSSQGIDRYIKARQGRSLT